MRVLVTGVSGLLGGRVARRLDSAGHSVRGLIRDPGRWVDPPGSAEPFQGDLCDSRQVVEAARGCEGIVHVAAVSRRSFRDRRTIDRVNVQGFGHVVEASRTTGARLVHVSSIVALGPTDGEVRDEEIPRATMEFQGDYERTLWVADQMARHLAGSDLPLVRLYTGFLFGPGALPSCNPVARVLRDHARGKRVRSGERSGPRRCFAYVDDVVEGALHALVQAPAGAAYILGGENRTMADLFDAFATATGRALPRPQRWRALLSAIRRRAGGEEAAQQRHAWAFSSERAVRELGYRITAFDTAVAEMAAWMHEEGQL